MFLSALFSLFLTSHSQTARSSSWHARYTVLTYLQTMVFYNLFIFLNNEDAVKDIRWLVISLLEDEQLEVKSKFNKFKESIMLPPPFFNLLVQ